MQTFKAIAALLHYPSAELQQANDELVELLKQEALIRGDLQARIIDFIDWLAGQDLLDLQETYVNTFDKGRARSLYLFEHVHGESRDRGQAMVDLRREYAEYGYEIDCAELPDYIPMFLEFCSQLSIEQAMQWFDQIGHLLKDLHARLVVHKSPYSVLFEPLLIIAGCKVDDKDILAKVAQEPADDTPEALDEVWMEDPVTFGADDACEQYNGLKLNKPDNHPFKVVRKRAQS